MGIFWGTLKLTELCIFFCVGVQNNGTIELELLLLFSFALNVCVHHQYKINRTVINLYGPRRKQKCFKKTRQKVYYSVVHFKLKLDRDIDNSYS